MVTGVILRGIFVAAVMGLMMFGWSGVTCAQTTPIALKLAHWVPPKHLIHTDIAEPWAREVEKRTGGKVKITIFPSEALGKVKDAYDMALGGLTDISLGSQSIQPARFLRTMVTDLPMLYPTGEVGSRTLMALYDKYLKTEYPDVKMLFLWTGQPMQIHMVKKPIRTVADFKGVKMRCTAGTPSEVAKLVGATPVVMATPEIYEALQRGIVEGTFISWESITQMGWHELLKYHTEANLFAVPFYAVMNMKSWQKLPPDVQKQIDEVSGDWGARMAGRNWDANCAKTKEQIKKLGGHEFIQLPPEEMEKLRKIVSVRPDNWVKEMESKGIPGREILNETLRLVKKYSE